MTWAIEIDVKASKQIKSLDQITQKRIYNFLLKLQCSSNPRKYGEALKGKLHLFWRFRVGDYRIISSISDRKLTIEVIAVDHRKQIYR